MVLLVQAFRLDLCSLVLDAQEVLGDQLSIRLNGLAIPKRKFLVNHPRCIPFLVCHFCLAFQELHLDQGDRGGQDLLDFLVHQAFQLLLLDLFHLLLLFLPEVQLDPLDLKLLVDLAYCCLQKLVGELSCFRREDLGDLEDQEHQVYQQDREDLVDREIQFFQ